MDPNMNITSNVQPKIVGGHIASLGDAPYQVLINYDNSFTCGGSIISTVLVLTAAHCVFPILTPKIYKFQVLAGVHDRSALNRGVQTRNVKFIYIHENYEARILENDIAIFVLSAPLRYNYNVKYINLPREREDFQGYSMVSGWGSMTEKGNSSMTLRKIRIPLVSSLVCRNTYAKDGRNMDNLLCIGESGKDSCEGDSGGPAVCTRRDSTPVLCGIVSFGIGCGHPGYPGVYTKVANFIGWIKNTEKKIYTEHRNWEPKKSQQNEFIGCIPDTFLCSAEWSCKDDKNNICNPLTQCRSKEFRCNNGRCIRRDYTCDGDNDCGDGSDEDRCKTQRKDCGRGHQCGVYGNCISQNSVCDGKGDCFDNSDEENCSPQTFQREVLPPPCSDKFLFTHYCSGDFICIPETFLCDGEVDCPTGSDELNCANTQSQLESQELRERWESITYSPCFLAQNLGFVMMAANLCFITLQS